jgi:hypothetical protein
MLLEFLKHPDLETEDWIKQKGEWSVKCEERFGNHLERLDLETKGYGYEPRWYG